MTRLPLTAVAWIALLSTAGVLAQIPQPLPRPRAQAPVGDADGVEVLARGPVHEGYASTAELPAAGEVVAKAPPDLIEELPPEQKPAGDNVQWIPGYWNWDEERADFIWISGFWRQPPPGRVWVPGTWREVRGGHQWVQGFWNATDPRQPQQPAQLEYLPPPPAPLELAPSVPAPTETCFYTPGVWQWRGNRFAWRPGFWVEHRPNWVWAPAHYRWTPAGYVFIDGYWDHTLAHRGILFAPVAFRPALRVQPQFVYTPVYVVTDTSLYGSMFVRRGYGSYYFGDYFEPAYARRGYSAWCGVSLRVGNFAVTVGRPAPVYDPLWSYYSVAYRHEPAWRSGVTDLYAGRYNGDFARPPRTLVQQNTVVNNITNIKNVTNVTNNTTVVNTTVNNVMLTKLTDVRPATQAAALVAVPQADRVREQTAARELRQVGSQRQKLETGIVDRGRTVAKATDAPQSVKLDLPKTAAVRSQAPVTNAPPEAPKPAGSQPTAPKTIPLASQPVPPTLPQPVRTKPEGKVDPKGPTQPPVVTPQPPLGPPVVKPPMQPPVPQPQPKPVVTPQPAPITNPPPKPPVVTPQPLPQPKPPVPAPVVNPKPPTVQPPAPIPVPVLPAPVVNPTPMPKPPVPPTQPPQLLGPPVVKPPVVVTPQPLPQPKPPMVVPPAPVPKPPVPVVQPQPLIQPKPPAPAPVVQPQPAPRPQPAPVVVQPPPAPRPPAPAPVVQPPPPRPQPQPPAVVPQPPAPPAQPPAPAPKPKDKEKDKKPG